MRRSKEDAEATRESLLGAAEQMFAEQGIHNTRLSDVAKAVGVTRGAIYWHFKNKDELISAIIDRLSTPLETAMQSLLKEAASGTMTLDALAETLVFSYQRLLEVPAAEKITRFAMRYSLCNESPVVSAQLTRNRDQNIARLTQIIGYAQQHELVRKDRSARQLALYIRAHIMGIYHQHLSSSELYPNGLEDIRLSIKLLFEGLKADA
ncbi:TetR family transcriptional regulator [uncultured Spongiibacter sp.]|uniref:TetR family transcriptional regulator n=1 Tax=Spongiibacter marinus TaxID=354246 RepID=UPI00258F5E67|nr:TetR family transcriptional regulator [uncultured Spongiibacter sp.]